MHFERRTREAGPAGQDGAPGGAETRPAAGQRSRRPQRVSTNFSQVGSESHAFDLWAGLALAGFLERGAGLDHLG